MLRQVERPGGTCGRSSQPRNTKRARPKCIGRARMDGTEKSFRATIRANPLDATARLVYADWLDDHGNPVDAARQRVCADPASDEMRLALAAEYEAEGDPERAEFVRTQVALGELPWGDVLRYCGDRET